MKGLSGNFSDKDFKDKHPISTQIKNQHNHKDSFEWLYKLLVNV